MAHDATPAWPDGCTVVLLTGGASRRLGRDKGTTHVGGEPLVERLLGQVPEQVPVVVVGPPLEDLPARATVAREEPPGSGPLAAIGAGVAEVRTPLVGVLAVDMPFAVVVMAQGLAVLASLPLATEAVVPVDAQGHRQPLCAAYRTNHLRAALGAVRRLAGAPVRSLFPHLAVMEWPVLGGELTDVDTARELQEARRRVAEEENMMEDWVTAVKDALGLDVAIDIDAVLDVARDAAHHVRRPAAPITAYLLGAAVARGADPVEAAAIVSRLAAAWPSPSPSE